jgi:hypothetical protein
MEDLGAGGLLVHEAYSRIQALTQGGGCRGIADREVSRRKKGVTIFSVNKE